MQKRENRQEDRRQQSKLWGSTTNLKKYFFGSGAVCWRLLSLDADVDGGKIARASGLKNNWLEAGFVSQGGESSQRKNH